MEPTQYYTADQGQVLPKPKLEKSSSETSQQVEETNLSTGALIDLASPIKPELTKCQTESMGELEF